MKKTLASLLATLTLVGPLPLYAQSIPQVTGVIAPIGAAGVAGGAASPNLASQGSLTGVSLGNAALVQPVLLIKPAIMTPSPARREGIAANPLDASIAVAGESEVRALPIASSDSREEAKTSLDVARGLAATAEPKASVTESSVRQSFFFDALDRVRSAGAPAAEEAPEAPHASPALAPTISNARLRAFGHRVAASALGRLLPTGIYSKLAEPGAEPPAPKKPSNTDEWGGPKSEARTIRGQALYGLKWAFNLVGITTLLSLTLGAVLAVTPWPIYLPETLLHLSGRVELLINYGPKAIAELLANAPISFLFVKVPVAVAMEEFSYRLVSFAQMFLTLAALKPIASWASDKLGALPDLYRIPTLARRLLARVGGLSRLAFPLAASSSALSFALAHVGEWGVDPFVLTVQLIAGLVLARTAYVSRGLVAPFVAHLGFTLITLLAPMLMINGFHGVGALLSMAVGIAGVVALYYNWRVHRRLSKAPAGIVAMLLAATIGWQAVGMGPVADQASARFTQQRPVAVQLQDEQDPHQGHGQLPPEIAQALKEALEATFDGEAVTDKSPDLAIPEIVRKSKPAIVTVRTPHGLGSGFIVNKEGMLVTNAHVVKSVGVGAKVMIVFANGMQVPGKVLAMTEQMDLALVALPTNPNGWPFVPLAPAGSLVEGQTVVTMGHPLGLPFSVSNGIVAGLGFRGIGLAYRIQITAPISHGNSGGPLFDLKGRVVGVNSAGIEKGSNLGFAIPVEEVVRAIEQFKRLGAIRSAHMGIIVQIGERMSQGPGTVIEHVRPGSPAEKAGLVAGDIIAGADRERFPPAAMPALNGLFQKLGAKNPGETIELLILRPQASGLAAPQVVKVTVDAK